MFTFEFVDLKRYVNLVKRNLFKLKWLSSVAVFCFLFFIFMYYGTQYESVRL